MVGNVLTLVLGICLASGIWLLLTSVRLIDGPASGGHTMAMRIRRHSLLPRIAGLALGLVGAYLAIGEYGLGLGQLVSVPIAAGGLLIGVLVEELLVSPPRSTTRHARIELRRMSDYLPIKLFILVAVLTGILALVLTVTTVTGVPDDLGRAGRALRVVCANGSVSQLGPWPGVFYSAPAALVILTGLLFGMLGLRRITERPRVGSDATSRLVDDDNRRRSARTIVSAYGLLVTGPLTGVALVSGLDLLQSCGSLTIHVVGLALVATGIASVVIFCWLIAAMLAVRMPRLGTVEQ